MKDGFLAFASFKANGRTSYGAVTDGGIVDLGRKLSKYPTLLDVFRAGAFGEARAAATGAADYQLKDVTMLPPILAPEKIICVGINYPERSAEYGNAAPQGPAEISEFVLPLPVVAGRHRRADRAAEGLGQVRLRRRDRAGDGQGRPPHPDRQGALHIGGLTLGNEGSVRDWLRHGSLNITQGKNFDASGSLGPWVVPADDVDPAKPLRVTTKVNGELRQDDTTDRLTWGFAWLINYISTFCTLRPGDLIWTGTPTGAGVPPHSAGLAQARRRGGGRGAGDRRAAEQGRG